MGRKDPEAARQYSIEYEATHREQRRQYYLDNQPQIQVRSREYKQRLKREVFENYGGCVCACCGEIHMEFLSLDHVNGRGSGAKHRKELNLGKRGGLRMYQILKRDGWPLGFRVLCMNCNFALGHFGYCPHQHVIA